MKKFNYTGHKKLWNWLADNPGKEKINYFIENKIKNIPVSHCYACEYKRENEKFGCNSNCPLDWGDNKTCLDDGSLYDNWYPFVKKSSEIAIQIANLPVREGVEYE